MESIVYKEEQISDVAHRLIQAAPSKVWAIHGTMGAGKTTLIKALIRVLGSEERTGSPTFGLVNEYINKDGSPLAYHFDFYRLDSPEEVLDIGFEEYLVSDAWVFMEWPERIGPYLPEDRWELQIEVLDSANRKISELKRET